MATLMSDALIPALVRELPAACAAVFGGTATPADVRPTAGEGWAARVPLSGATSGHLVVWLDARSAATCAERSAPNDQQAGDDRVAAAVSALMARLASVVGPSPEAAGVTLGTATVAKVSRPETAIDAAVAFDDGATVTFGLGIDPSPAAVAAVAAVAAGVADSASDSRLEAVLDVDLPLVVRFGRAVMPLRAVAELGPGAVVDMGRTPDEPVDLLVGERLVARGEVVVVGGNYGVRITEITNGRRSTDVEGRA